MNPKTIQAVLKVITGENATTNMTKIFSQLSSTERSELQSSFEQAFKDAEQLDMIESIRLKAEEDAKQAMLAELESRGMSAEAALAALNFNTSTKLNKVRDGGVTAPVDVEYEGKQFPIRLGGNISKVAREALKKSGLEREEFIAKYQVN